jgi:hypothetical protein
MFRGREECGRLFSFSAESLGTVFPTCQRRGKQGDKKLKGDFYSNISTNPSHRTLTMIKFLKDYVPALNVPCMAPPSIESPPAST